MATTTRNRSNLTEDMASMQQVREMFEQQKMHYKELMQQQETSYKNFTQIIMNTANQRVDELMKEIYELKSSLQFTQKEVDDLKLSCKKLSSDYGSNEKDTHKLAESLQMIDSKSDYLESQQRRNNIVVDGIPESPNEKWSDSEEKVRKMIQEKLHLDQSNICLERVHRTGKPRTLTEDTTNTRPRTIVVKFLRFKDREAVLQRAKQLKGTNIYLNEDFPEAVRQKRKELLPAMRAARDRGDIAYLRYDKLITHPPSQPRNDQK